MVNRVTSTGPRFYFVIAMGLWRYTIHRTTGPRIKFGLQDVGKIGLEDIEKMPLERLLG